MSDQLRSDMIQGDFSLYTYEEKVCDKYMHNKV